jgi:hypothetical protein
MAETVSECHFGSAAHNLQPSQAPIARRTPSASR